MKKKMLKILFWAVLFINCIYYVSAAPETVYSSSSDCKSSPTVICCQGCEVTVGETVEISLTGLSVDMGSATPTKSIKVTMKGKSFTYKGRTYGGQGTCTISDIGFVSCNFEGSGNYDGTAVSAGVSANIDGFGCTPPAESCEIPGLGLTVPAGAFFRYRKQPLPPVIYIYKGNIKIKDITKLDGIYISTNPCYSPERPHTPACSLVTPQGEHMYTKFCDWRETSSFSQKCIQIKSGDYILGKFVTVSKYNTQGLLQYTFQHTGGNDNKPLLFTHNAKTDCFSDQYMHMSCLKVLELGTIPITNSIQARLHSGTLDFSYDPDNLYLTSVTYYRTNIEGNDYGFTIRDLKKKIKYLSFVRKGNSIITSRSPDPLPSRLASIIVNIPPYPPPKNKKTYIRSADPNVWACGSCGEVLKLHSTATSFFNFVGKAWGWITGKAGEEIPNPTNPPPTPSSCGTIGWIEEGNPPEIVYTGGPVLKPCIYWGCG